MVRMSLCIKEAIFFSFRYVRCLYKLVNWSRHTVRKIYLMVLREFRNPTINELPVLALRVKYWVAHYNFHSERWEHWSDRYFGDPIRMNHSIRILFSSQVAFFIFITEKQHNDECFSRWWFFWLVFVKSTCDTFMRDNGVLRKPWRPLPSCMRQAKGS